MAGTSREISSTMDENHDEYCIRFECTHKNSYTHLNHIILYYVPRRIMKVIMRRATMLAGDRSQDVAETKPRRDQPCEHFKRVS